MDDEVLQGPADGRTLATAVMANWEALEAYLVEQFGGRLDDSPGLFRFAVGLHTGFLNGLLRADDSIEDLAALVEGSRRLFAERQVPWRWVVGNTSAVGLADRLAAIGLERRWEMAGMAIDLEAIVEPAMLAAPWVDGGATAGANGPVVAEVLTTAELEGWLSVRRVNLGLDEATADAWRIAHGRPGLGADRPLRHFTAWESGRPLANATLFLGAGVGGVYHVDTLPEARGRGLGTAVTVAALHAARDAGYRYLVLSASQLGDPVYRRLGFIDAGHVSGFVGSLS